MTRTVDLKLPVTGMMLWLRVIISRPVRKGFFLKPQIENQDLFHLISGNEIAVLLKKSSLGLILVILGLSVVGVLFSFSEGDFSACPQPVGAPVYVRAISDGSSGLPLSGVEISGSVVWTCSTTDVPRYIDQYNSIPLHSTPANGTVLVGSIIGNYSLTASYSGNKYSVNFGPTTEKPFLVTISLPSGQVNVTQ